MKPDHGPGPCEFHLCDTCHPPPMPRDPRSLDDIEAEADEADEAGIDMPIATDELRHLISRARDAERLEQELSALRSRCEIQQTELEVLRRPSRYGGEGGLVTIDLRGDDD